MPAPADMGLNPDKGQYYKITQTLSSK